MRKVIPILIGLVLAGLAAFTLYKNKKEINQAAVQKEEKMVIPVNVESVSKQTIGSAFSYIGTFMPNREVPIGAESQGKILQVMVKEGDFVKQGQVLAKIDDEMLKLKLQAEQAALETQKLGLITAENGVKTAQAAILTAQTVLNKAKTDVQRFENLAKENATTDIAVQNAKLGVTQAESGLNQAEMALRQSQMGVEQARFGVKSAEIQIKTTEDMIENTRILAPISGVVTARNFDVGAMVGPGVPLGMVTDVSQLKLTVMIPEADVLKFKEGQTVSVMTDIYNGVKFAGRVSLISVKSDNAHGYKVEVAVNNSSSNPIKAGMYGRLMGEGSAGKAGLFIPRNVIVGDIKTPTVFVAQGSKAIMRKVTLGASSGDWLEVAEGLVEGEKLITSGQVNLEDGSPIEITTQVVK